MVKRIAVIAGSIVLLLAAAAAMALWTIDPDDLRGELADAASGALGREVRLAGKLDVEISLSPTVVVRDAAIANAAWGSSPEMVRVGRMEARVHLIPYLRSGVLRISRFHLRDAEILLETNEAGVGNWILAPAEATPPKEEAPAPVLDSIDIENVRVTYRGPKGATPRTLAIKRLAGASEGKDGAMRLTWDVAYDGTPITGQGKVGPIRALADPTAPYPVSLAAKALGFDIGLSGALVDRAREPRADLSVTVKSKDPSTVAPLLGGARIPALPLELSADVSASAAATRVRRFQLALGRSRLDGSLVFRAGQPRPAIDGGIAGERLDLVELMGREEAAPPAKPEQSASDAEMSDEKVATEKMATEEKADAEKADKKVFPTDPLPLGPLGALDARLDIRVAELLTPALEARDASAKVVLENVRLELPDYAATFAGGRIQGSALVDGSRDIPDVAFALRTRRFDLGRFLKDVGFEDVVATTGDVDIELRGGGRSVAEIMAGLNGEVRLLFGGGRIKTGELDTIVGGVSGILRNLALGASDWTDLNCVAHDLAVVDGIATSKLLLIDTGRTTIIGEGSIDLKRERIAMKVSPRPKSPTINVTVPVRIGGTLARPSFTPDELGTLSKIGGLIGAVLFPPAAIAVFADLGATDAHPCAKVVAPPPLPANRPAGRAKD